MRGKAFNKLKAHFFEKADSALEKLGELLWKPILEECAGLREYLDGDARCAKPVGEDCSFFSCPFGEEQGASWLCSLCLKACKAHTLKLRPRPVPLFFSLVLVLLTDILFTRSQLVLDPV